MRTHMTETSPNTLARIAGVLYLVITVAAIFAHFVRAGRVDCPGDAAATAANITASESLFRIGRLAAN